jgi:3-mercaptopyruvate sulfurtransferase SseA
MSGWNSKFDKWTPNISDRALQSPNWSATNTIQQPVSFGYPKTAATETTGEAILRERVAYMLSKGLQGVAAADVLAAPTTFFINNYWTEADVNQYGHIKGAYRINETLKIANDGLKNLDPNSTIVVYCWTGQTSALVSSYLNVLGYNAKSISFGANALINSQLQKNKWTVSGNFPYVTN